MQPVVFLRGNPGNRGPSVPRQFLEVVAGENRQPFKDGSSRLELARAIASKDNPLTARVMVNQNLNEGAGSPRNGLPFTLSLSCGTWGGTITTENVNARHFVNLTWVSRPIPPRDLDPETLFASHLERYGR